MNGYVGMRPPDDALARARCISRSITPRNATHHAPKFIFFLTFKRSDSIYESRCDFSKSQIRIGESVNEERNQESRCEEESCSEEKEVAPAPSRRTHQ